MVNQEAIEFLKHAGLDFSKFKKDGISHEDFSEDFMASGFICNPRFNWIVFHGSFDFGYFLKIVSGEDLPKKVPDFFSKVKMYFPKIFDIKIITANITSLGKSLKSYGRNLDVQRIGTAH